MFPGQRETVFLKINRVIKPLSKIVCSLILFLKITGNVSYGQVIHLGSWNIVSEQCVPAGTFRLSF